jgi:hypothetical protein
VQDADQTVGQAAECAFKVMIGAISARTVIG